jgi:hypothetical protein
MSSTAIPAGRSAQMERHALWRTAEVALYVGIAAALFLTAVWFIHPSSSDGGTYDNLADYLFTGNGVPFGAAPLVLLWALLRVHGERVGRMATIGVGIASVSLLALIVVLAASVAVGHEVQGGPTYILGTLGSIIGIALFCASAARAGLLPRAALWFWAFAWTVGGMLGPKGSQLLLAAAYTVLLVHARRRAGGPRPPPRRRVLPERARPPRRVAARDQQRCQWCGWQGGGAAGADRWTKSKATWRPVAVAAPLKANGPTFRLLSVAPVDHTGTQLLPSSE